METRLSYQGWKNAIVIAQKKMQMLQTLRRVDETVRKSTKQSQHESQTCYLHLPDKAHHLLSFWWRQEDSRKTSKKENIKKERTHEISS